MVSFELSDEQDNQPIFSSSSISADRPHILDRILYKKCFVDLKLPSGTLWASKNIGATCENSPSSWIGDYFAWGEIYPKKLYNVTTYSVGKDINDLAHETDAATCRYGEKYVIPSYRHVQELIMNTIHAYVESYQGIYGINGYLLTSVHDTSKSIFFPLSGALNCTKPIDESSAKFWSSDGFDPANACYCNFHIEPAMSICGKQYGLPIRAICALDDL